MIEQIIQCLVASGRAWTYTLRKVGAFREILIRVGPDVVLNCISSLSSPTMIKYGINNIRELVGHKVNLQMVYDSPLCRLDAEQGSLQAQETT